MSSPALSYRKLNWVRKSCRLLLLLLLGPGMEGTAAGQNYQVRAYSEDDGLPSSTVFDMAQDSRGRMWFATRAGIAMYDSARWLTFTAADGLPVLNYRRLAIDATDVVWALASEGQPEVVSFDGDRWHTLAPLPRRDGDFPTDLVVLRGSELVVGVGTGKGDLFIWRGTAWEQPADPHGMLAGPVALAATDSRFWVATTHGLALLETAAESLRLEPISGFPTGPVRALAVDLSLNSGARLWVLGENWLGTLDDGQPSSFPLTLEAARSRFWYSLAPDGQGGVVLSNGDQIRHHGANGVNRSLGVNHGLASNSSYALLYDREKNLWVGGTSGVSVVTSQRFANFNRRHGLLQDEVSAALELASGALLLGHNNGLTRLEGDHAEQLPFTRCHEQSSSGRVMDLAQDQEGNVWAATYACGLLRIAPQGAWRWYGPEDGIPPRLSSLNVGTSGDLWVGGAGLTRVRRGVFESIELPGPGPAFVRRMADHPDGRMTLAITDRGLLIGRPGAWRWVHTVEGGRADNLYTVLVDLEGMVWAGSAEGLYQLHGEQLVRASLAGHFLEREVYLLVEDLEKRLWVGTGHGVYRWDGKKLDHFSVREGLSGRETNRGAGLVDRQGRVWIGTNTGISRYQPSLDHSPPPPRVAMLGLEVAGRRLFTTTAQRFSHRENSLTFLFEGISFKDEEHLEFSTRLEGLESEWLLPFRAADRRVRYTSLPPGQYRLHLRARNPGGEWSPAASSPAVFIEPPLWQKGWFRLLAAVGLGALTLILHRVASDRRYARQLEQEVRRRTEELRRARDEAEAGNRAKSIFLATVSHEIRTPMNGVIGMAGLLQQEELLPGQRDKINTLRSSAEALLTILDDILEYSKIEAGRLTLEHQPFALRPTLSGAVELFRHQAEAKGLDLSWRILSTVPENLEGDAPRLRQVLTNLVGNAIKFTDSGEVEVTVKVVSPPADEQNGHSELLFSVRDTGIGLTPEHQEHLFEPFSQADSSVWRRYGGTGLGLAICRRLIELSGGRIWVESVPAEGTTFHFTTPAKPVEQIRLSEAFEEPKLDPDFAAAHPLSILVADDNAVNLAITGALLEHLGYQAATAVDGREVLDQLAQQPYDLILMDVQMPRMDGLEACRQIRRWEGPHQPCIAAVTALALEGDRELCLAAGMDEYLSKPIRTAELLAVLERASAMRITKPATGLDLDADSISS